MPCDAMRCDAMLGDDPEHVGVLRVATFRIWNPRLDSLPPSSSISSSALLQATTARTLVLRPCGGAEGGAEAAEEGGSMREWFELLGALVERAQESRP